MCVFVCLKSYREPEHTGKKSIFTFLTWNQLVICFTWGFGFKYETKFRIKCYLTIKVSLMLVDLPITQNIICQQKRESRRMHSSNLILYFGPQVYNIGLILISDLWNSLITDICMALIFHLLIHLFIDVLIMWHGPNDPTTQCQRQNLENIYRHLVLCQPMQRKLSFYQFTGLPEKYWIYVHFLL